jgi:hypothetical protein
MFANTLRVVFVGISLVLFLFASYFGDGIRSSPSPQCQALGFVSLGFVLSGGLALIAAAIMRPDK